MSIICYLSHLLVPHTASAFPRMIANEASVLEKTSKFILERYLGYDTISTLFIDQPLGYDCTATSSNTVGKFISDYEFPYPIESIQATTVNEECSAEIKYQPGLLLSRETLHFERSNLKIKSIQTIYSNGSFEIDRFVRRIHVCGGGDQQNSINALQSARLLKLASNFLQADVSQNLEKQHSLLLEDSVAFGVRGSDNIITAQKEGIDAGTTYSLPFPLQVNIDNKCVSLDFLSHKNGVTERGTDIMYFDLLKEKVVRIDTLRHTLNQPAWVRTHFTM